MGTIYNNDLYKAVLAGYEKDVNKYLLKGVNPNFETEEGLTPLTKAILNGHDSIVELLLKAGANPNLEVISRGLPLDIIVKQNDFSCLKPYFENDWYLCSYLLECPNTPLYIAIAMRNLRIVELFLKYGAKANFSENGVKENANSIPPVLFAILVSDYEIVKALLPAINNIDEKWGKNSETLLMAALKLGDTKVAKLLIEKGADINVKDRNSCTPLLIAIEFCNKDFIEELIKEYGAHVNTKDEVYSPLMAAIELGNIEIVEILLKYGANPNLKNIYGDTSLIKLVMLGSYHDAIAKLLVRYGAKFEIGNNSGTPLIIASGLGDKEAIKSFIKLGADINYQHNKMTALLRAISSNRIDIVKYLLFLGAIIPKGKALYEAVLGNNIDIINLLLKYGADPMHINDEDFENIEIKMKYFLSSYASVAGKVNQWIEQRKLKRKNKTKLKRKIQSDHTIKNKAFKAIENSNINEIEHILGTGIDPNSLISEQKLTLLGEACQNGCYEIAELLLKNKADPNKHKGYNYAPLRKASTCGHIEIAKLLLKYGADPAIEEAGNNLLHESMIFNNPDMLKLLLKAGANPNLKDQIFNTVFSRVVKHHSLEVVKLFLEHGADPNLGGNDGDSLLEYAIKKGKEDVAILLLEYGVTPILSNFDICLDISIEQSLLKIGQMLIDMGAITQLPEDTITKILDYSIEYKDLNMIKFMLSNHRELKLTAKDIKKGFNWAAAYGEIKILKQLMKYILYLKSYDKNINISPAISSLVKEKESELGQLFCSNYQTNIIEPANSEHNLH